MSDATVVVESRTIISRFGVRENAFAARVAATVSQHTVTGGEVASNASVTVASGVTKIFQLSVEKPLMVRITVAGTVNTTVDMTVTEHLILTAPLESVTLINTATDNALAPVAYRVLFA